MRHIRETCSHQRSRWPAIIPSLTLLLAVVPGASAQTYSLVTSGTCTSAGMSDVSSAAACGAAASALGLSDTTATTGSYTTGAPGCTFYSSTTTLYFNTKSASADPCTSADQCICSSASASESCTPHPTETSCNTAASNRLTYNSVAYGCCCSGSHEGKLCQECASSPTPCVVPPSPPSPPLPPGEGGGEGGPCCGCTIADDSEAAAACQACGSTSQGVSTSNGVGEYTCQNGQTGRVNNRFGPPSPPIFPCGDIPAQKVDTLFDMGLDMVNADDSSSPPSSPPSCAFAYLQKCNELCPNHIYVDLNGKEIPANMAVDVADDVGTFSCGCCIGGTVSPPPKEVEEEASVSIDFSAIPVWAWEFSWYGVKIIGYFPSLHVARCEGGPFAFFT